MKILIMSDSHGDVDIMCGAVEKEQPDMIIHLGDSIKDAEQLNLKYPDIRMYKNPGNIDSKEESIQYAEIYGKRFMMTHGNQFAVTSESPEINDEGREKMMLQLYHNKADILLHGHILTRR
ncbi:MAG: metallophosphoesterase family protein [Oscillospiraceae bacterium]|nr:metallophosphoesterase family protein [Oscillospiraceae bacterium]